MNQERHVEAANKCLNEAFNLLVKANDLLFDAGWAKADGEGRLSTVDTVNQAITEVRHARWLMAVIKDGHVCMEVE